MHWLMLLELVKQGLLAQGSAHCWHAALLSVETHPNPLQEHDALTGQDTPVEGSTPYTSSQVFRTLALVLHGSAAQNEVHSTHA